jgi:GntR family transcriptional regulator/MocR family aminotransferase
MSSTTRVGVENPCFREAINTFCSPTPISCRTRWMKKGSCSTMLPAITTTSPRPPGADRGGDEPARRGQLLEHAARHDAVIIEDDYDSESNFMLNPLPALKASDRSGRVIYVSSLSKALSPGLRLGFMVADPDLIDEARALRRLVIAIRRPTFSIRWPIFSPRGTMKPTCGATTMTPPSAGSA